MRDTPERYQDPLIGTISNAIHERQKEHDAEKKASEDAIEMLRNEKKELEDIIAVSKNEKKGFQDTITTLENEKKEFKNKIAALKNEKQEIQQEKISELRQMIHSQETQITELSSQNAAMRKAKEEDQIYIESLRKSSKEFKMRWYREQYVRKVMARSLEYAEKQRPNLAGMYKQYDKLQKSNAKLSSKVAGLVNLAALPSKMSPAQKRVLNELEGVPLEQLPEYKAEYRYCTFEGGSGGSFRKPEDDYGYVIHTKAGSSLF